MLVRLFGQNFRSLKDPFELSLVAADYSGVNDRGRGVIEVPILGMAEPLGLLRSIGIYGANASGKSTVLMASRALQWLGLNSSANAKPGGKIGTYEPFLLDGSLKHAPIELGCDVVHKNSILRYELRFSGHAVESETLTKINGKREFRLINRQPTGPVGGSLIKRSPANQLYVKEMQPNITVLSKLAQHGPNKGSESVLPYYQSIRNALWNEDYGNATNERISLRQSEEARFADDDKYREWIMAHLIRAADVGICDVNTHREEFKLPKVVSDQMETSNPDFAISDKRVVVSFVHEGASNSPIEFGEESSGTKKLFNLAKDWWRLSKESVTLFADELSASLHPRLLDRLVRVVNEPIHERQASQLVFSTHDTGLLESQDGLPPALRRDQVYFTRKGTKGATELYSLAEFKDEARPVHNIRKRYLSGLYGAIPSVENISL